MLIETMVKFVVAEADWPSQCEKRTTLLAYGFVNASNAVVVCHLLSCMFTLICGSPFTHTESKQLLTVIVV